MLTACPRHGADPPKPKFIEKSKQKRDDPKSSRCSSMPLARSSAGASLLRRRALSSSAFFFRSRNKQRECALYRSLEHGSLRTDTRQNPHAQQNAQQKPGQIIVRSRARDRAILLPGEDALAEKRLEEGQLLSDDPAKLRIVRSKLQRRIDQHAAAPLSIRDRALDDLFEEAVDRLLGRQLSEPRHPTAHALIEIMIEATAVEQPLVAERIVEAGARNARLMHKIPDRSRLVPVRPEALHGGLQNHSFVELSWPCHRVRLVQMPRNPAAHPHLLTF